MLTPMKMTDLQNHTPEALQAKLVELEQAYYSAREAVRSGKESNHARLKGMRRDIARVKTLLPKS